MNVAQTLLSMYATLFPTIFAGIINSLWCKSSLLSKLKVPIDFNKNFIDNKRIFGDNKTWKGLIGYIILNIVSQIIWGAICDVVNINHINYFYVNHTNTLLYNLLLGFFLGVFYAFFELPNSFMKRRLGIEAGKPPKGLKKVFFIFIDQADSVFGVCLVVAMFYKMSIGFYLTYVIIGAVTHILLNMLLFALKIRKNMF